MPPLHTRIRSALRFVWMMSPERKEAVKRAKLGRGWYRCEMCKTTIKKYQIDHIIPVGPTPGSRNATPDTTWDGFIRRMWCSAMGLQLLCLGCNRLKTNGDR